jgi:2-oxoglutarate dehydrogenase E2 component (dihydrolipoamide succinyltransferase)
LDESEKSPSTGAAGPAAKHAAAETGIDLAQVSGTGPRGRILKQDVLVQSRKSDERAPVGQEREPRREPMSRLRRTIAGRLVNAQHEAAILTTFNEVDLHEINTIRARYKETFEKTHGARLGFMSFFVKACAEALKRYPIINASVDDDDILFHDYYDIGIAVSSPRGLVVPVLRDAQKLGLAEIELAIADFGDRARNGNLGMDDLAGGTFTITNGGVFGSMLSTPILNPPQSAILGMHKIQDRPVAISGEVVIRPMMYMALSYDHRIIDGADAVSFLVAVKETLEDPARLLLEL